MVAVRSALAHQFRVVATLRGLTVSNLRVVPCPGSRCAGPARGER